jgi:hypothetical protein
MAAYPSSALRVFAVAVGADAEGGGELVAMADAELGIGVAPTRASLPALGPQGREVGRREAIWTPPAFSRSAWG